MYVVQIRHTSLVFSALLLHQDASPNMLQGKALKNKLKRNTLSSGYTRLFRFLHVFPGIVECNEEGNEGSDQKTSVTILHGGGTSRLLLSNEPSGWNGRGIGKENIYIRTIK